MRSIIALIYIMKYLVTILLTLIVSSCSVKYQELPDKYTAHYVQEVSNDIFKTISMKKSESGNELLKNIDYECYQLIFVNNNRQVEYNFFFSRLESKKITENFSQKTFLSTIPSFTPFKNKYKVELYFIDSQNYDIRNTTDVVNDKIKFFFYMKYIDNKSQIGNSIMDAISTVNHELTHVDSALENLKLSKLQEEIKASYIEICSLFFMPAFNNVVLKNSSSMHEKMFMSINETSELGKNLAIEKMLKVTNKNIITSSDLKSNNQIKKSCYEI